VYPIWVVDLPLNDVYPGMVSFIRVRLWADTGEVINIQPLGSGGTFNESADNSHQLYPIASQNNGIDSKNSSLLTIYITTTCLATVIPIAIVAMVFKRRTK
jgi:hypothetical protein